MIDLRARYMKLLALAEDQAGLPEGETAARLAASMLETYPELHVPVEAKTTKVLAYRHGFDRTLLAQVADFLELEAFRVGRHRSDGKGIRWRQALRLEGPAGLLDLAAEFYDAHRQRLDEILEYAAAGYAFGAFPVESDLDEDEDEDRETPDLTPAQLQALEAGHAAGRSNREARPIPESHRLTDGGSGG